MLKIAGNSSFRGKIEFHGKKSSFAISGQNEFPSKRTKKAWRFNAAKSMEMLYKAPLPSQVDASGHNFIILHVHERTWGGVNVLILMIWWAKASHEQKIFSPKGLQLTLYSQLSV